MESFKPGEPSPTIIGNSDSTTHETDRELYLRHSPTGLEMSPTRYSERQGVPDLSENEVGVVIIFGTPIISLFVEGKERLCLAQISNTLLRQFSYNEIHNRRVALGISCMQCTPIQLEILRRLGAMPISSRRCGLITRREAERLVKSFLVDNTPPTLPDNFYFKVYHKCGWGSEGHFIPTRYNSSRAKCIKCIYCSVFFSPNKFIFHFHRTASTEYRHADAANFNSWRKHLHLVEPVPSEDIVHAWEDVKAMFNGGSRKRLTINPAPLSSKPNNKDIRYTPYSQKENSSATEQIPTTTGERITHAVPSFPVNSSLYNLSSGDPLLSRTHPAFPKPRLPTSYGEFFRTLSAPYSMWWMKYAPTITAGYNLSQTPRSSFELAPQITQSWPVHLKRMHELNTSGDEAEYKYNGFNMAEQWNGLNLMQPTRTVFAESGATDNKEAFGEDVGLSKPKYAGGHEVAVDVCDFSNRVRDSYGAEKITSLSVRDASPHDVRLQSGVPDELPPREKHSTREQDAAADVSSTSSYGPPSPPVSTLKTFTQTSADDQHTTEDEEEMEKKCQSSEIISEDQSLSDGEMDNFASDNVDLERISVEKLRTLLSKAKKLKNKAARHRKRLRHTFEEYCTKEEKANNSDLNQVKDWKDNQDEINAFCSKTPLVERERYAKMLSSEMVEVNANRT